MADNLAADGGLVMAENIALQLARHVSRSEARAVIRRCSEESNARNIAFADVLRQDPEVRSHLSEEQINAALDPAGYLGSIDELIGRAQIAHREAGTYR